jgi:sugar/nucleoside kinase (ribokinase family)
MSEQPNLVVVGSIGIDTIETPHEKQPDILGGSASYACAASSFFSRTGMVGVVGTDFPEVHRQVWGAMNIDLNGLQTVTGETFKWHGVYEENMDNRSTISTELGVFADFTPELPPAYRNAPYLFLGNISPELQLHVLDQMENPKFVLVDTMDLWINIARENLEKVISRVTMLTLNESEARLLTGERTVLAAAKHLLSMGPQYVLIKKGESGSVLFTKGTIFMLHAYPLESFKDPTGAGDTFAGGFIGKLAEFDEITSASIRQAMAYGSVVASYGIEEFSLDRLAKLERADIDARYAEFLEMSRIS